MIKKDTKKDTKRGIQDSHTRTGGACLVLARCLPEVGEVPACLLACMPCRSECSENVDYDRNHHLFLAVQERGAGEVLGEVPA